MRRRVAVGSAMAAALITLAGCSSAAAPPTANAADRTFLQDMIPHHERAIAVARLGERRASDPRVLAFARRIVREQTPELRAMQRQVRDQNVHIDTATGAAMAQHRITDTQVSALTALRGRAFDSRFLALNITSEQGAAAMARDELAHGVSSDARSVAKGIARAPDTEIPELRELAARLG